MNNWSGNQVWHPTEVLYPASETAIQQIVRVAQQEGRRIRVIGSGHSFTPLVVSDDILLSLDRLRGVIALHEGAQEVEVYAGTKLYDLNRALYNKGYALENLGDIDRQSIAGAISTGTHGTGMAFGNLSTQIKEITFINAQAERITCSAEMHPELFKCMQISLGALGIITRIRLRCVPAFALALHKKKEKLSEVLVRYPEHIRQHRHFEFYWFPYTDTVQTKYGNISTDSERTSSFWKYIDEVILENHVFGMLCKTARLFPRLNRPVSRILASAVTNSQQVEDSHTILTTPRWVRFNEMEYNVPLAAYPTVMRDVVAAVNQGGFPIHFPLECRFVQQDDIYLSPAYQRDSAYIACHVYQGKPYRDYFARLEEIFVAHGGRPHWGKLHTRRAEDLANLYPKWEIFQQHRREQDPDGVFLNGYLNILFG